MSLEASTPIATPNATFRTYTLSQNTNHFYNWIIGIVPFLFDYFDWQLIYYDHLLCRLAECNFGSFCIRFTLNSEEYLPDFIVQYINSIYGQAQITMLETGSDKKNINQSYIADIRIPKIGIPEQRKILSNYKKITEESFNIIEVEEKS